MKNKKGFSSVRALTLAAMLTAMSVVIGIFCKNLLDFGGVFRVTFEGLPIIISGLIFGPIVGGIVGAVSDMLSYMLSTQSFAISPIITLGAALIGIVSGTVSHYIIKKEGRAKIICSTILAHLLGSVIVKSLGLYLYFGWAILYRIPIYAFIVTVETVVICLLYKNKNFCKLIERTGERK